MITIYAHYDIINNQLLGWYPSDMHDEIPTPNFIVDADIYDEALTMAFNHCNPENGTLDNVDYSSVDTRLIKEINKAKSYLKSTDFKMTSDYDQDVSEVIILRAEARLFIRENDIQE